MPPRITVLISGSGTNLQAVIDAVASKNLDAEVVRVVSNRKNAYGLERAEKANIPTLYHNLLQYKKKHPETDDGIRAAREEYDAELARLVLEDKPALVACLGFMHVVSTAFLDPLERANVEVINLHPALPGQFSGINAIERAQEEWLKGNIDKTGVMIHKVIAEVDMGEAIVVKEIPFQEGDEDIKKLEERVHQVEWVAVIEGIRLMLEKVA